MRQDDRVEPDSKTETYAAIGVERGNLRWVGVPFYLRNGKRLGKRVPEVKIVFKQSPTHLFKTGSNDEEIQPNVITMRIQPNEGISLHFGPKEPGPTTTVPHSDLPSTYPHFSLHPPPTVYDRFLFAPIL